MKNLSDITEGRDIVTKSYVDTKIADVKVDLPTVEENVLTWAETISPEANVSLGIINASVGDIIKVKAVNENGVPTAWEKAEMPSTDEKWVLLGEYDMSLTENQVGTIKINKYEDKPFTVYKIFTYSSNVKISSSYCRIGTEKGNIQWGYGQFHNYSYIFPLSSGTYQIGSSSNQYFTGVGTATQGQPFTSSPLLPANEIQIIAHYGNFTTGTIKVWAVIEQ